MSTSSIGQLSELSEDVLQMIFQKLEDEELVICEAVCRQWRNVLLAGTPWRRFFHRKILCSLLWRKEQEKLESNLQTLPTDQYRGVCKKLLQVTRNWRTGNFKKFTCEVESFDCRTLTISEDYVAWDFSSSVERRYGGYMFLDTESMKIRKIPSTEHDQFLEEMVVGWSDRTSSVIEVRDPKNQWKVNAGNEAERGYDNRQIAFGSGRLVEYSRLYSNGTERMRMWKMGNQPTLLHDRTFEGRNLKILKVDEQFIVAIEDSVEYGSDVVYFFSTETLEIFTSLGLKDCRWEYHRGLFFQYRGDGIQILDVATGTFFNDVHMFFRKDRKIFIYLLDTWARSNSNVVVIGWGYWNKERLSCLSVYDLEAVKKRNSDPCSHLLYTLQFKFNIPSFVMDETRIALIGYDAKYKKSVTVLIFANFAFDERKTHRMLVNTSQSGKAHSLNAPGFRKNKKNKRGKRGRNSGLKQYPEIVKMKIIYNRRVDFKSRY